MPQTLPNKNTTSMKKYVMIMVKSMYRILIPTCPITTHFVLQMLIYTVNSKRCEKCGILFDLEASKCSKNKFKRSGKEKNLMSQ